MTKKEPFLTGFSSFLFGSAKSRKQDVFNSKIYDLNTAKASNLSMLFESILPAEILSKFESAKRRKNIKGQTKYEERACCVGLRCVGCFYG